MTNEIEQRALRRGSNDGEIDEIWQIVRGLQREISLVQISQADIKRQQDINTAEIGRLREMPPRIYEQISDMGQRLTGMMASGSTVAVAAQHSVDLLSTTVTTLATQFKDHLIDAGNLTQRIAGAEKTIGELMSIRGQLRTIMWAMGMWAALQATVTGVLIAHIRGS